MHKFKYRKVVDEDPDLLESNHRTFVCGEVGEDADGTSYWKFTDCPLCLNERSDYSISNCKRQQRHYYKHRKRKVLNAKKN